MWFCYNSVRDLPLAQNKRYGKKSQYNKPCLYQPWFKSISKLPLQIVKSFEFSASYSDGFQFHTLSKLLLSKRKRRQLGDRFFSFLFTDVYGKLTEMQIMWDGGCEGMLQKLRESFHFPSLFIYFFYSFHRFLINMWLWKIQIFAKRISEKIQDKIGMKNSCWLLHIVSYFQVCSLVYMKYDHL